MILKTATSIVTPFFHKGTYIVIAGLLATVAVVYWGVAFSSVTYVPKHMYKFIKGKQ